MYRWFLNLSLVTLAFAAASALFGFGAIPSSSGNVAKPLFFVFVVLSAIGLGAARLAHISRQNARRETAWRRYLLPPFVSVRKGTLKPTTPKGASP